MADWVAGCLGGWPCGRVAVWPGVRVVGKAAGCPGGQMGGRVVGKSNFNENPAVSLDLDLDFGVQLRVCQLLKRNNLQIH